MKTRLVCIPDAFVSNMRATSRSTLCPVLLIGPVALTLREVERSFRTFAADRTAL